MEKRQEIETLTGLLSHSLRKRFVKDWELPLTILKTPYFEYFLELYSDHLGTLDKLNMLMDVVKDVGEKGFFEESEKFTQSIISDISNNLAWKEFNESNLDKYNVSPDVSQEDVYRSENANENFLFIDMKKANFQALKYVNPNIVFNHPDYETLASQYTNRKYFIESKYVRQVIFGNLNPKRARKVMRYIIFNVILPELRKNIFPLDIVSASDDSIILKIDNYENPITLINTIKMILSNLNIVCHTELYKLIKLAEDTPYYIKESLMSWKSEFKGVPSHYYAECYKFYNKIPLEEYDLCSYYDGRIVKFMDRLFK